MEVSLYKSNGNIVAIDLDIYDRCVLRWNIHAHMHALDWGFTHISNF